MAKKKNTEAQTINFRIDSDLLEKLKTLSDSYAKKEHIPDFTLSDYMRRLVSIHVENEEKKK